ncbi:hypothetical protein AVEN_63926-1 [Araneus ventricosus]|uniref:Uncharacterized protein n=1 Tax=Araneus ventricosus TaxID=182803 RepID=A0A4Y2UIN6_ARAVE|nr:hypothetical protein AVEN_111246-1 [Araneus ventricosus]GBO12949.1 hypothetical protein AVEN_189370-1 [Araneus ventricosus]GBO28631.1 hypothetical protein AVEN_249645-1 [Araneus ventricosus]GBO28632.1 hypothetical protein AVEN_63926-1 [Araneus ventricosus]
MAPYIVGPRWPSGKVSTSGPEGRRFENPIPLKICRVWGLLHTKSYAVAKRPPIGVAQKYQHWPGLPKKGARTVEDQRGEPHQHVEDGIYWVQ